MLLPDGSAASDGAHATGLRDVTSDAGGAALEEEENELFSDQRPLLGCDLGLLGGFPPTQAAASPWDSTGGSAAGSSAAGTSTGAGIEYHGGAVMGMNASVGTRVHLIWYGNWTGNSALTLLPHVVTHASGASPCSRHAAANANSSHAALRLTSSGSDYMKINSQYYSDVARAFVSPTLVLGAQFSFVGYPRGATLSDAAVQALVADAMAPDTPGALAYDASAMYIVLTSADVALSSGFCTSYCGWHTASNVLGRHTRFGFVGNGARCPTACAGLTQNIAPNGNLGADAMASILMHEIVEVLTDPDLDGCVPARVRRVSAACMHAVLFKRLRLRRWYDGGGMENADKCAWRYGSIRRLPSGRVFNVNWGGKYFLIQQNWVPRSTGGLCALS